VAKSRAWKDAEKKVANALGGKRNQRVILRFFDSIPDIESFLMIGEIKHGYKQPTYFKKWFAEVEKYYKEDKRARILFWGKKNGRLDDKLVLMKMIEFKKFLELIKDFNEHKYRYDINELTNNFKKQIDTLSIQLNNYLAMVNGRG